jgi:hypothetical protein
MADPDIAVNIYELLDIDPSLILLAADAKKRIETSRMAWNKKSSFPGHPGEIARLKRSQLASLEANLDFTGMCDKELEAELARHREAFLNQRKQREEVARKRLAAEIEFASRKGQILQREIDAWVVAYSTVATRDEISAMAEPYVPREQVDGRLSQDRLDEIEKSLGVLNEESLFSFVGMNPSASDEEMIQAAGQLYAEAMRRGMKGDWPSRKNLSGEVSAIFSNPAHAQQYRSHARRQKFYRAYLQPVEVTCRATPEITSPQVDYLLSLAGNDGWKREDAVEDLFTIAYQHGWRVLPPVVAGAEPDDNLKKQLNEYKRRVADAERRKRAAEERARTEQEERERFEKKSQEVERQLAIAQDKAQRERERLERQIWAAERRLAVSQTEAKDGQARSKAELASAQILVQALRRQLDEIKQYEASEMRQRTEEAGPRFTLCLERAELIAAQQIVKSLPSVPPQWQADVQRIERDIAEAKRLLNEAKHALSRSEAQSEDLVIRALELCSDLEPALTFKSRLPIAPPTHLQVHVDNGAVVTLTWRPSASRNTRYSVVRSTRLAPLIPENGDLIASTEKCEWRDMSPPAGLPLWYAIFATRDGVNSHQAASLSSPLCVTPDVEDLRVEVGDAQITLSWLVPQNAQSIVIVRNETHAPSSPKDGHLYALGLASRFTDDELANGRRYFYRVYSEYEDTQGEAHLSEGVAISGAPEPIPSTVPAITLCGIDGLLNHTVHIEAQLPERGRLIVYRTSLAPPLKPGARMPIEQLQSLLGGGWREITDGKDIMSKPGVFFYTSVIQFHKIAIVGERQVYQYCPPVRNLKAYDDPQQGIHLHWEWPSECLAIELHYQRTAPTMSPPTQLAFARNGARQGDYLLRDVSDGEYMVDVLARYFFNGRDVYSRVQSVRVSHRV